MNFESIVDSIIHIYEDLTAKIVFFLLFSKFPGCWDSCGVGHHCLGDFTLATSGFPMYNLLCLQVLSGQEEKA